MSVNWQVLDKLGVTIGSSHYDFIQESTTSAGATLWLIVRQFPASLTTLMVTFNLPIHTRS